MELERAIKGRRSIRRYTQAPVPREVIEEILDVARWTPSFANTQPWEFTVACGEPLETLRCRLREAAEKDPEGKPEIPWPTFVEPYLSRRKQAGNLTTTALGINEGDKARRESWRLFGMGFFDAPCVIVISMDRCFTAWGILDVGAVAHSIMLLAHSKGLGTCPQAAPMRFPALFHEALGIPATKLPVLALPIGYPEPAAEVNRFARVRASLDELVTWKGMAA